MHIRLLYVSRPVGPQTTTVTESILRTAQAHNRQHGISGVLCQGQGLYLQVLEGERRPVNQLYARILADRRHGDVELLLYDEVTQPRFSGWSMAHVALSCDDPMVQMNHPEFDPYSASGAVMLEWLVNLLDSGQKISLTQLG